MRLSVKAVRALAMLPLFVVAVVLLAVASPVIALLEAKARISLRRFRRREAGTFYLVCASRRGWHDFLRNNLIPVLPDDTQAVWCGRARGGRRRAFFSHLARSGILGVPKPYLVAVTRRTLMHKSLNGALQELKARPKVSEHTRESCAGIIAEARDELAGTPSPPPQ